MNETECCRDERRIGAEDVKRDQRRCIEMKKEGGDDRDVGGMRHVAGVWSDEDHQ